MGKAETREKIIKCSKKLFSTKGFEGVRTKEIAESAGISEVTLYKYFRSKQDLYDTINKEEFTELDVNQIFEGITYRDIIKDIETVYIHFVNHFYKNKDIILMHQKECKNIWKKGKYHIEDDLMYIRLVLLLEEYWKIGTLKRKPETVASLLVLNLKGSCRMALEEDLPKRAFTDNIMDFLEVIFYGILNEKIK